MNIYTVRPGDTAYAIAARFGTSVAQLAADNALPPSFALVVGQSLVIRRPSVVRTADDDTPITSIAADFGTSPRALYRANYALHGAPVLSAGETAVISYVREPDEPALLGGYAYDFIDDTLLDTVLPYLNYLSPFTYGFTEDGALLPNADARLLERAARYGTTPLLHLSTLGPDGRFDSRLPGTVFDDPAARKRLLSDLLDTVSEKGYAGVDVDFEYLPAAYRYAYVGFIAELTERLNRTGRICVVALSPKTRDDQPGLLYEGIDYAGLGAAANFAFLMTYEWGYKYGPPLAVAPLDAVTRVVEYAKTVIPDTKLLLGLANYGYDWRLPYIAGKTAAKTLSYVSALETARRYGASVAFDETACSPYYTYYDENGAEHIVWFEDARSIAEKAALIRRQKLRGAFIWELNRVDPPLFVTLAGSFADASRG